MALIQKLEETAQAIYHHTFVEGIDKENLPEGWRMRTLGEVCEYNTANLKSTHTFSSILYLDTSSVTKNKFGNYTTITSEAKRPSRAKRLVKENDILYSSVRPNLCHYGIIRNVKANTVVSTGFIVLRSIIDYISNDFLFCAITQPEITTYLQDVAEQAKSTYPSIADEDLMKIEIAIPNRTYFEEGNGSIFTTIYKNMSILHQESRYLRTLLTLLTSKLS